MWVLMPESEVTSTQNATALHSSVWNGVQRCGLEIDVTHSKASASKSDCFVWRFVLLLEVTRFRSRGKLGVGEWDVGSEQSLLLSQEETQSGKQHSSLWFLSSINRSYISPKCLMVEALKSRMSAHSERVRVTETAGDASGGF